MSSKRRDVTRFMPVVHRKGWRSRQNGKVGWILMWLIGIPIPVLVVLFLIRGCT